MTLLSIVVPVYNEEENLEEFLKNLKKVVDDNKLDCEIIVVDDGSQDKTPEIIKKSHLKQIRHPYNKGYGAALKTGARAAEGDYVLFIDGDGQHNPEDILKLKEYLSEYDMVVGARVFDKTAPATRRFAKKILSVVANYLSDTRISDLNSGFRAIRRNILLDYLDMLPNSFSFTTTITVFFVKSGFNITYVPIEVKKRKGRSKINPVVDFTRFILLLVRATLLFTPLKVFLPASIILGFLGVVDLAWGIYYSFNIPDSAVFLLMTSMVLLFFGFLSDQISIIRRSRT